MRDSSCTECSVDSDHSASLNRLNRVVGQLRGIERMIQERKYCPDILTQLRAAQSAMKSLEGVILKGHVECCVETAVRSKDSREARGKVEELMRLFLRN